MQPHTADPVLAGTKYFVEATDFERQKLWEMFEETCAWEPVNQGRLVTVGTLGNEPIVVELTWAYLYRQNVCFYHSTSNVVDHTQIRNWILANSTAEDPLPMCDAMNFAHCMHAMEAASIEAEKRRKIVPKGLKEDKPLARLCTDLQLV